MKKILMVTALSLSLLSVRAPVMAAEQINSSHLHLGHVLTQWHDTPAQKGLVTTALEETKIALQHASVSAKKLDDLQWMQLHTSHVMHALDPTTITKGPGRGYGLIKASKGVAKHIKVAAKQEDASEALKLHSVHVATIANSATNWAEQAVNLCITIMSTDSTPEAAASVQQLVALLEQIQLGNDANGDGKVSWQKDEGGLQQSLKHAQVIANLDGVN